MKTLALALAVVVAALIYQPDLASRAHTFVVEKWDSWKHETVQ
jgi:hypothetical protein